MRLPIPSPSAPPSALVAAAIAAGRLAAAPAQAAALPALDALYGALPAAAAAAASHRAAVVEWQTAMAAAAAASAARRRWRWRRGPPPSDAAPATTAVAVAPAAGTASRIEHRRETLLGRAADALVATGVVGVGLSPPHPPVPPVPPRGLALVGGVGAGKTLLMDAFVAAAAGVPGVRVRRLHTAELLAGVYARLRWWDAATHADRAAAGVGSPTEAAAAVALWGGGADGGSCAARDLSLGGDRLDCSPADAVGRVVPGWPEGLADGWTSGGSGFDDSLPPAAARVLCVDEVAVPDVGTRVVLGGVLRSLVGGGVVLVFTANRGVAEMDRSGSGGVFLEDLMDRDMVMVHVGEGGGGGGGAEGDWRVAAALRGVGRAEAVAEVPPLPGAGVPAAATAPQPPYPLSSDWRAGADAADTSCGAPFSGTLIPPVSNLGSFFTPLCTAIEAAVEARWTALTGTAWADAVSVALPPPTPGLSPLCIPHAVTLPPPPPPPEAVAQMAAACGDSDHRRAGDRRGHGSGGSLAVAVPSAFSPVHAARFTFDELCGAALAPADYAALAAHVDVLFLTHIPRLSTAAGVRDGARRLITAVDALAEAQVVLVLSAEAPLEALWEPPLAAAGGAATDTGTGTAAATAAATEAALDLAEAAEFETEAVREGVGAANRGGGLYSGEDVAYAWARAASRLRAATAVSAALEGVADVHAAVAAARGRGGWARHLSPAGVWGGSRGRGEGGRGWQGGVLYTPPSS